MLNLVRLNTVLFKLLWKHIICIFIRPIINAKKCYIILNHREGGREKLANINYNIQNDSSIYYPYFNILFISSFIILVITIINHL